MSEDSTAPATGADPTPPPADPSSGDTPADPTDYKALYEETVAERDRWKSSSRKWEDQARGKAKGSQPKPTEPAAQPDDRDKRIADLEASLAARDVERHVERRIRALGMDVDQLLDSNRFLDAVDSLDIGDDGLNDKQFNTALDELIKKHGKPRSSAPSRLGVDVTGNGGRQRATSLGAAITAAYQQ
jgi:hypothetical protein